jgi:hypothetical protein
MFTACAGSPAAAPKDIVGFCKDTTCPPDGDPCTLDCDEAKDQCAHTAQPAGSVCDDGDACTTGETCSAAGCKGTAVTCDDKNTCTADSCDKAKGCQFVATTGGCNADDNACTVGDACKDGKCVAGAAKDCDDNNVCTKDGCDPTSGCTNKPADGSCNDKDACTKDDACDAGKCVGGGKVEVDDKDPCTDDSCDPKGGAVHTKNTASCDDGDKCTQGEACQDGKCAGGTAITTDDGNPCTADACDAKTGVSHSAKDGPCNDNDACTEGDACKSGACVGGGKLKVDDGNPCTADSCDVKLGVVNAPKDGPCDDGNACTDGDTCLAGACKPGAAKTCPDDGSPCTVEACDKLGGCVSTPAPADIKCSDGNLCTEGDTCSGGKCIGGALKDAKACAGDDKVCKDWNCDAVKGCTWSAMAKGASCSDGSACTDSDACDGGACIPGTKVECNDNNPCTDDACDKTSGCKHTANAVPCDDKNACTTGDMCKDQGCAPGAPKSCDDGKECTVDKCDTVSGVCSSFNAANGAACDDGDKCTGASACKDGQCAGSSPVTCKDDGNVCTSDACDPLTGCAYAPAAGSCDADGNVCTDKDACSGGKCVAGNILVCDDKNPCTDDSCDKLKGCLNLANTAKCDDGLLCTEGDTCKDGKCAVNTPKNCSDANDCTDDKCDPVKGCLSANSLKGSECSDGQACSIGDACDGKASCKSSGAALWTYKDDTWAGTWDDAANDVAPAPDGGLVYVGYFKIGPDTFGGFMRRLDPTGQKVFDMTFKDNASFPQAGNRSHLRRVAAVKNGYIAIGDGDPGKTGWADPRPYVVRVSATGEKLWEKAHGQGWDGFFGMAASADGSVVAVGGLNTAGYEHGAMVEINNAGIPGADVPFPVPNSAYSGMQCNDIATATTGGGYWLACTLFLKSGGTDATILRVVNYQIVFSKNFGLGFNGNGVRSINRIVADAGGVFAVGYWQSQATDVYHPMSIRLDNNGNGKEVVISTAMDEQWYGLSAANEGGYLVSGTTAYTKGDGLLARVSADGLVGMRTTYNLGPYSLFRNVAQQPGGNVLLAGRFYANSLGDSDPIAAMCDAFGNCDCASSGTCLSKKLADCDDANPCTLDTCDSGSCKHAIGNEGLPCGTSLTCQKGKCAP